MRLRRRPPAWSDVNSDAKDALNGVTSGVEASPHKVSLHKVSLHKNSSYKPIALFQFLVDLMGGTDETLSSDLRVARGYRVCSATASAARHDRPAARAAGAPAAAPAAAEVTLFRP